MSASLSGLRSVVDLGLSDASMAVRDVSVTCKSITVIGSLGGTNQKKGLGMALIP